MRETYKVTSLISSEFQSPFYAFVSAILSSASREKNLGGKIDNWIIDNGLSM